MDLQTRFQETFDFRMQEHAQNVFVIEPPDIEKWQRNYFIVEWQVTKGEMDVFISKSIQNYSPWRPLSEFSVGGHFFTYVQMPNAMMTEWHSGDASRILVADVPNNKIIACFWLN